jgi:aminomethyltransferase
MRRSPLHDLNASIGARFVDFGGWEMPVQYDSVLAEHRAVRDSVGVFDVTHLGRFALAGPGAESALSHLLCNDISRIGPGRCQYTMLLNNDGGIVDDLIVWWRDDGTYWVMPNAANHERVMDEFRDASGCEVGDLQEGTVFLAVQGPEAPGMIKEVVGAKPGRFRNLAVDWGQNLLSMAGTGYTGEPGGELCIDAGDGEALMRAFLDAGARACGLGARDTLRLEAGLPLWGEDIDETTTPLEAGLDFAVSLDHEFVGKEALVKQRERGLERRLAGIVLDGRGIPRHGYEVRAGRGGEGTVTSGNLSPVLDSGVSLAYMSPPSEVGGDVEVNIRDRWVPGRVVDPPFHTAKA